VGALLLPVALFGFLYATEQFRRAQETPDLDLFWPDEAGGTTKQMTVKTRFKPKTKSWIFPLRFALLNRGPVVCQWCMLEFEIPVELTPRNFDWQKHWKPIVGELDSNWKVATIVRTGAHLYAFMSNGTIAAYPHFPLLLGDVPVTLYANREWPAQCRIRYKIATDRGRPIEGSLTLHLVQEPV